MGGFSTGSGRSQSFFIIIYFYFFIIFALFPFLQLTLFEQRICVSKEGAKVRVLKGIRDAANWQRGDFLGAICPKVVLGAGGPEE